MEYFCAVQRCGIICYQARDQVANAQMNRILKSIFDDDPSCIEDQISMLMIQLCF